MVLNGSTVTYPAQKRIVVATNRDRPSVLHALQQGLAMARADGGRVWIVRTHVLHGEELAWQAAFHSTGLQPTTLRVGPEPLLVVAPSR